MMRLINLKVASLVISRCLSEAQLLPTIRFWTIEDKPPRLAKQQAMADDFKAKTGHEVEVIRPTKKIWANARQQHSPPVTCRM